MTELPREIEHELAALADGSLAQERRERATARVSDSRELRAALAEQRRAVELVAAVDVLAPASLHRQVEALREPIRRKRRLATVRIGFAGAAAALAAAALAVSLSGGASG